MSSWMQAVKEIDFAARASSNERKILVSLTGTADLTVRSQLERFVREVHTEARRCLAEEVTVDVSHVEFMNSSCLKCFVWWVSTLKELSGDGRYRIVFLSNPSVYWQRRSLGALAGLAGDIVTVQA